MIDVIMELDEAQAQALTTSIIELMESFTAVFIIVLAVFMLTLALTRKFRNK